MDHRPEGLGERMDERFERVDERFTQVDQRFDRLEGQVKEMRVALKDLHDDNKATNRVMVQGFIGLSGAMVAGCVLLAGASAF